jgi:hypothetical protein
MLRISLIACVCCVASCGAVDEVIIPDVDCCVPRPQPEEVVEEPAEQPEELLNVFDFPKELSWSNIDTDGDGECENYVTSIKLQECSDCYIHTATGLLETQYNIDHRLSNNDINLSENSLRRCTGMTCSQAGGVASILEAIQEYGAIHQKDELSDDVVSGDCEPDVFREYVFPIKNYISFKKIVGIHNTWVHKDDEPWYVRKIKLVKALQNGPVAIIVRHFRGFFKESENNPYVQNCSEVNDEGRSAHSNVVVGYKNHGNTFIVKNSHGEDSLLHMNVDDNDFCGFAIMAWQISETFKGAY